ncbi:Zinc carboxypeptidase [Flavobacteriaceae bacterium MAR_2010_188]|nr:Zinc carboxypeptidase [Flavobacteriaceae bacterium MAR_2010_188]
MKKLSILIFCFPVMLSFGQKDSELVNIFKEYENYHENSLNERRIKHSDILPLIKTLESDPNFSVSMVGKSMEDRSLNLISFGEGATDVLLWSQMHGDEPTATQAIFDLINFFRSESHSDFKKSILKSLKIHFLPMLNPDGAERFTRRNVLGIDINRDAVILQTPEGQTLKRMRDSLDADFGFNLHDQSTYYNAMNTEKPATLSFLAPAFNLKKDMNPVRENAMKVIVEMNNTLQQYIPGQIARYNDDFETRAFGDNIQKWGTSTILIESGGFKDDPEKQEIRKYNFIALLTALNSISNNSYKTNKSSDYSKIPVNDKMLFDLKIEGVTYNFKGNDYTIDLGINQHEINADSSFYNNGRVIDLGDLSTYYGYTTLNAKNMKIVEGKVLPETFQNISQLDLDKAYKLLEEGYLYIRLEDLPKDKLMAKFPINIISADKKLNKFWVGLGRTPNFFLQENGTIKYAVVNGFLVDISSRETNLMNAEILD